MSPAFLDAPRALQRWRQLALAASLLLAVGSGLVMSGRLGGPREGSRGAGDDPREGLLERFDVRRRADVVSEGLTPVSFYPGRGLPDYWHGDPASAEAARRAAQNLVGRGRREANADKGD